MSYPSAKRHTPSRRHLGKNQQPQTLGIPVTVTGSGSTAIITYTTPVVVAGKVALTVSGLTPSTQAVTAPNVVTVTYPSAVATHTYTYTAGDPNVRSAQGGQTFGTSGTF